MWGFRPSWYSGLRYDSFHDLQLHTQASFLYSWPCWEVQHPGADSASLSSSRPKVHGIVCQSESIKLGVTCGGMIKHVRNSPDSCPQKGAPGFYLAARAPRRALMLALLVVVKITERPFHGLLKIVEACLTVCRCSH